MGPTLRGVSGERIKKKMKALNKSRVGLDQGKGSLQIGGSPPSTPPSAPTGWLDVWVSLPSRRVARGFPSYPKGLGWVCQESPGGPSVCRRKRGAMFQARVRGNNCLGSG